MGSAARPSNSLKAPCFLAGSPQNLGNVLLLLGLSCIPSPELGCFNPAAGKKKPKPYSSPLSPGCCVTQVLFPAGFWWLLPSLGTWGHTHTPCRASTVPALSCLRCLSGLIPLSGIILTGFWRRRERICHCSAWGVRRPPPSPPNVLSRLGDTRGCWWRGV